MSLIVSTPRELIKLRCDHTALRFQWELTKRAYYDRKFRPDQLRVPKGEDGGGRFAFEGNEPAAAQPIFYAPAISLAAKTIEAGIALYLALSNHTLLDKQAVIAFNAKEYTPNGEGSLNFESVAALSRKDVDSACPKFEEVQQRTDAAVDHVRATRGDMRPSDFGTAVHSDLKDQIKELRDPNFRAEVSYMNNRKRRRTVSRARSGSTCSNVLATERSASTISKPGEVDLVSGV